MDPLTLCRRAVRLNVTLGLGVLFAGGAGAAVPAQPLSVPVGGNPSGLALDAATYTVYVTNQTDNTVSVIDDRRCNAQIAGPCVPVATITLGAGGLVSGPYDVVVDQSTDTLYVASSNDNTVSVIDGATCNALVRVGCAQAPRKIPVGSSPVAIKDNPATHTLYVGNLSDNTVSVINSATCNAVITAGCSQTPPVAHVGTAPFDLAVNADSDTVYVTNTEDDTVSVVNGATCNALVHAGCTQTAPTIHVGGAPDAIDIDPRTHTAYVANSGVSISGGSVPGGGTVSVIDTSGCNATHTAGCATQPPTVAVGAGAFGVAVDPDTHDVYVADNFDNTVSVIEGAYCSAVAWVPKQCKKSALTLPAGDGPSLSLVDAGARTLYVADGLGNDVAMLSLLQ